jgi:DNA-binding transcriptional LysR family regulator
MQREAPAVQVRSVVLEPAELERQLESGDVDLAIGYFPDLVSSNLQQQLLFEHKFACLVRHGHPEVSGELTLDQFLSLQHVMVEHRARRKDLFERILEKAGLSRSVALYLPNYVNVPFMLEDSDLIATVARPLANKFAPLCGLQICEPPLPTEQIEVKQFWHRRDQRSPRHVWLRAIIRDIFQNKPYLRA